MKVSVPAGFWRIFGARMIDLLLVALFSFSSLFIFLDPKTKHFSHNYYFYIWAILTILLIVLFMIAIPLFSKGKSIGCFITRIQLISLKENIYKALLKRETAYSLAWIFMIILSMAIINHTLINKVAILKGTLATSSGTLMPISRTAPVLTMWDKTRINICGSISGLLSFIQMWLAITIIPHKEKRGWLDRWASTQYIRINKTIIIEVDDKSIIKPIKVSEVSVEYN